MSILDHSDSQSKCNSSSNRVGKLTAVIISATNHFKFFQINTWRKFNTVTQNFTLLKITVCYQLMTVLVRVKSDLTVNCFKINSRRLGRFYINHYNPVIA